MKSILFIKKSNSNQQKLIYNLSSCIKHKYYNYMLIVLTMMLYIFNNGAIYIVTKVENTRVQYRVQFKFIISINKSMARKRINQQIQLSSQMEI